ncbi:N-acetylmuramoyl-L-alanine amidase family protein [Clostridiisalibacter paucivorans]|uniref:N-acetylmuramoyl-L-alanine amidase family protein n=1 Tax=Clostridiisalibacter paucivorans TaxID=408753 RepID=UPI0006883F16|nr:N-acetylmuramoyl-L-alanine amidase [Clostridiisalibacter paucivorans]
MIHSRRSLTAIRRERRRKRRLRRRLFTFLTLIIIMSTFMFIKCSPNYIFTICIDPGHGGYDPGTANESYEVNEKDLVLDISLKLGKILEEQDVKVVYTREKDKIPWSTQIESLMGRSEISNDANADLFLSIHANDFTESSDVKGTEVWCRFENTEDEALAKEINYRLSNIGYTKNRGLRYEKDGELYVLKNTNATSVLVELGYLSNNNDLEFLSSEEGKEQCAQALAEGIMNYYHSKQEEQMDA